jgi:hypothetical protein
MTRRPHTRSASILAEVARIRDERAAEPLRQRAAVLARALDAVNAVDALSDAKRAMPRLLTWGPRTVAAFAPLVWVGAVLWRRAPGYTGYQSLRIMGAWALEDGDGARIVAGAKTVRYAAAFYEPEAYHALIVNSFDLYYDDDGGPPPASAWTFNALCEPSQRLELRAALASALGAL